MDEINYEELDPGIREVVRRVRAAGFITTDSGDGVSKPVDWYQPDENGITQAMSFPHVVCRVYPKDLIDEAYRLAMLLGWRVEATYCPNDGTAILLAMGEPESDLRVLPKTEEP